MAERGPARNGCSEDAFLGGALSILQPKAGYRAGLDAVMLAAAVPARPGERVLEAGSGGGVAALCLARRVPGMHVTGVELSAAAAALARENARRNGLADRLQVIEADIAMPGAEWPARGLKPDTFDHAFANPPYHEATRMRPPADAGRALAHMRPAGALEDWARFLVAMTRSRGSVTVILPAALAGEAFAMFARRLGRLTVCPLFARTDKPAIRIVVQGIKGSRAAPRLLRGLVLHDAAGAPTPEADSVLRGAAALDLAG